MTGKKGELLEAVRALIPRIAERAVACEAARRPHDASIRELIDAGVMQTLVPERFGGHELDLDTLAALARTLSSACVSTGWVTTFYIGHNWVITKFPEEAQREVFADRPFGLIAIQPAPNLSAKSVPGGYEITGRASFGSGIMHADWVVVEKTAGDDARAYLMPVSDVRIDDVWHMVGMAGTGSNDAIFDAAFVPEHRTIGLPELFFGTQSVYPNPLYSMPVLPFLYCEFMGVYCGALDGAIDAFEEHVRRKVGTWSGESVAGKQAAHIHLGDAHARGRAAGIMLDALIVDTMALAARRRFPLEARLDLKGRAAWLADLCRDSVNAMMARAGTGNFHVESTLQRHFRDLNVLATHAFVDWDASRELLGRLRLGLDPNSPLC